MQRVTKKTSTGWAVEINLGEYTGFAGIFYFNSIRSRIAEVSDMVGLRTMVFRTRQQARAAAKELGCGNGAKLTPVKVMVTVERADE